MSVDSPLPGDDETLPDNGRCVWRGGGFRVMGYINRDGQRYTVEQGNATEGFNRVGPIYLEKDLAIDAASKPNPT